MSETLVGTATILTCCDWTGSALPELSTEKNWTLVVPGVFNVNAAVYFVLAVVGVEPSVVK